MKRTAAQAGFPVESQTVRVTVCVPADRCTRNEPMVFSLVCHNSDNVSSLTGSEKPQAAARNCPDSSYIRMADIFRLLNLPHHWPLWMQ